MFYKDKLVLVTGGTGFVKFLTSPYHIMVCQTNSALGTEHYMMSEKR